MAREIPPHPHGGEGTYRGGMRADALHSFRRLPITCSQVGAPSPDRSCGDTRPTLAARTAFLVPNHDKPRGVPSPHNHAKFDRSPSRSGNHAQPGGLPVSSFHACRCHASSARSCAARRHPLRQIAALAVAVATLGAIEFARAAQASASAASDLVELTRVKGPKPNIYDWFGSAVAVDGERAIVGAPSGDKTPSEFSTGVAFVFRRDGDGWVQEAALAAPDAGFGDKFGAAVAISGDLVAIGAPRSSGPGKAYVFERIAGTWTYQQTLTSGGGLLDRYGFALALQGTRLAVGAPFFATAPAVQTGAVFVYQRTGSTFNFDATLASTGGNGLDDFGYSISLAGERMAIGAPGYRDAAPNNVGAAFLFLHGAGWTQQARILRNDLADQSRFAQSVSLSGTTLLIGAPAVQGTGKAYVYLEAPVGTWTEQAQLQPVVPAADDRIGQSVALTGDKALVGAPGRDLAGDSDAGAAFEFQRSGVAWTPVQTLLPLNAPLNGSLGYAMAFDRGTAFVGQPQITNPAASLDRTGRAFIYTFPFPTSVAIGNVSPAEQARVGQPATVSVAVDASGLNVVHGDVVVQGHVFGNPAAETECTVQLGLAETGCALTFPTGGTKTITASYQGAPGFAPSELPGPDFFYTAVTTLTSASMLVHSPNPNAPTSAVAVSMQVSPVAPGGGTVSGTVNVTANTSGPVFDPQGCTYTLPAQSSCNLNLTLRGDYGINAQLLGNISYGTSNVLSSSHRVNHLPVVAPSPYFTTEDNALQITDPYGLLTPGNPNDNGPLSNDSDTDANIGQVLTVVNPLAIVPGGIGGSLQMNANGTFSYVPPANANGQATLSFNVTDGVESVAAVVPINVDAINDKPVITLLGDQVWPAGTGGGAKTVPGFVSSFSPGPPDEQSTQSLSFYATQVIADPDGVMACCTLGNNGTLEYFLGAVPGVALLSVTATDTGSTAAGGQDTSDPRYFHIVVGPQSAELSISKSNGSDRLRQYQQTSYTITVSNAGPDTALGAPVLDILPATLKNASWTCLGQGGGTCPANGSGGIDTVVTLPAQASVTFTLTATVDSPTDAPVVNTATVSAPGGYTDSATNNSATDNDPVDLFRDGFE